MPGWSTSTSRASLRPGSRMETASSCVPGLNTVCSSSAFSIEMLRRICPAAVEHETSRRRGDGQEPAVIRPPQRGRRDVDRRAPHESAGVGVPQDDRAARVVRNGVRPGRIPGRRHRGGVAVEQMVARAVAGDDSQAAPREVGDPRVCRRSFPARPDRIAARERPVDAVLDVQGREMVRRRGDDVQTVRRPFGIGVRAELALVAFRVSQPDAAAFRRDDEQASRCRQGEERRLGPAHTDRFADAIEHGATRRREDGGDRDHGERGDSRDEQPRAAPAARGRGALLERPAHDLPGARFGVVHAPSFMRSSPRRNREFTVPRGRSRISAISPGVYSST